MLTAARNSARFGTRFLRTTTGSKHRILLQGNKASPCASISTTGSLRHPTNTTLKPRKDEGEDTDAIPADQASSLGPKDETEHAVISAFDLFSIGGRVAFLAIDGPY